MDTSLLTLSLGVIKRVGRTLLLSSSRASERQQLGELYNLYNKSALSDLPEDPNKLPKTDILKLANLDTNFLVEGLDECGFGHITEFELKVICALIQQLQPQNVFEIGTFEGRTTLNMALNTGIDARIYTLDLPQQELDKTKMDIEAGEVMYVQKAESGIRFKNHPSAGKIQQLFGDSATFDYSDYVGQMDVVFIDGSHAYDYVLSDTKNAFTLVRPGGTILWHDYTNWEGVRRALNDYYLSGNPAFSQLQHIGGTSIALLQNISPN
jgi:predicted O-methyltransferase YrrM